MKSFGPGFQNKWTFWKHVQAPPFGVGVLINRGTGDGQFNNNFAFQTNRWYMLTFSASGTSCFIAVNGVAVSTLTGNLSLPNTTGAALSIGGPEPSGYQWFRGGLDDIRIYNRALSTNEVSQLFVLEAPPTCEETVAALRLQLETAHTLNAIQQSQLEAANSTITNLETQLAGANHLVQELEDELFDINQSLQRLTRDFQIAFKNPGFQIPGANTPSRVNNVVISLEKLNKGQQQAIFFNLGGEK